MCPSVQGYPCAPCLHTLNNSLRIAFPLNATRRKRDFATPALSALVSSVFAVIKCESATVGALWGIGRHDSTRSKTLAFITINLWRRDKSRLYVNHLMMVFTIGDDVSRKFLNYLQNYFFALFPSSSLESVFFLKLCFFSKSASIELLMSRIHLKSLLWMGIAGNDGKK